MVVILVGGGGLFFGVMGFFDGMVVKDGFVFCELEGVLSLKWVFEVGGLVMLLKVDNFVDGVVVVWIGDFNFVVFFIFLFD